MKKLLILVLIAISFSTVYAQAPEKFNYQAIMRDASGAVIPNRAIQIRIGIYEGSTAGILRYEETHLDTTNNFGLVSLQIGTGTATAGSMSDVKWESNVHAMKLEVDPNGGTNWERLSTSEFLSTPYALHANTATYGRDEDADTTNELQSLSMSNDTIFLSQGGFVTVAGSGPNLDNDSTNEIQMLSISNDTIYLSDGGIAVLPSTSVNNDNDSTNELNSAVALAGTNLNITDAGGMKTADLSSLEESQAIIDSAAAIRADIPTLAPNNDNDSTNEIQMLSISNDTIYLSDGGIAVLPSTSINNDNDSTNEIQMLSISNDTIYLSDGGIAVLPSTSINNDNDSTNEIQMLSISNDTIYLSDGGIAVLPSTSINNDNDSTNEIQMLSISNDTIYLSDGGIAVLPSTSVNNDNDSTNELNSAVALAGTNLNITDAGGMKTADLSSLEESQAIIDSAAAIRADIPTVAINNDNDSTNEIQMLSISNDTIYLSDGGIAVLPSTSVNNDNDSTNEIQMLSISNDTIYLSDGGIAVLPSTSVNNDNDSTNELNTTVALAGTNLNITDAGGMKTADLSSLEESQAIIDSAAAIRADFPTVAANNDNDSTNELNTTVALVGTNLNITDAGGMKTADLSSLEESQAIIDSAAAIRADFPTVAANNDNDSTNELNTAVALAGTNLNITDAGGMKTADLSSLEESQAIIDSAAAIRADFPTVAANNDNDSTNELNTTVALAGTNLNITDAGGMKTADLSSLEESQAIIDSAAAIRADFPTVAANNDNDSTNELISSLSVSNDSLLIMEGGIQSRTDLSLINYWNKSGNNLDFRTGRVYIGTASGNGFVSIIDSSIGRGLRVESISSLSNIGIDGYALSSATNNNTQYGVVGNAIGTSGTSGTGNHYGVYGNAVGGGAYAAGVYGTATGTLATSGTARGVDGIANSTTAQYNQGIFGYASNPGTGSNGYNAGATGDATGHTILNYGVLGLNSGTGNKNYGGAFYAYGNVSGTKKNYGMYGYSWGADTNIAIYGYAKDDPAAVNYGIYTEVAGASSLAGRFIGNVRIEGNLDITGSISKGSGTFKIDHPLDPENKYLVHSFVESPDMMNIYNGNATTDANGEVIVTLPNYFESANKEFRYQLTPIGDFAQCIIKEEISGNTFKIATDKPNVKVSWQVTGVRADPYSNSNRIVPEVDKDNNEKGLYLHPKAYGFEDSKSLYKSVDAGDTKQTVKMLKESGGKINSKTDLNQD